MPLRMRSKQIPDSSCSLSIWKIEDCSIVAPRMKLWSNSELLCFCFHFKGNNRKTGFSLITVKMIIPWRWSASQNRNLILILLRVICLYRLSRFFLGIPYNQAVISYVRLEVICALSGGMTHLRSEPLAILHCCLTSSGFLRLQSMNKKQLAVSVHKWSSTLVGLILWHMTPPPHQNHHHTHTDSFIFWGTSLMIHESCAAGGGLLSERLPLWETLLGIHARECRKLYVISLTAELFHFSFV